MNTIILINSICTGIVLTSSIVLFIFGNKILSTIFHAIFWFVIFLYLLTYNIHEAGIFTGYPVSSIIQFFIPAFYTLFLMVFINKNKFRLIFLLVLIIPLVSIYFVENQMYSIYYHLILWAVLTFVSIYYRLKSSEARKKEINSLNIINMLLIFISVFPFIIINLVMITFFNKEKMFESILFPCLAFVSLMVLLFGYNQSIITMNHQYYTSLDFLKKSSASEKRTLLEKISAGLVHEIKNPVTAIQSLNQQLFKNHNKMSDNKIEEYLAIIHKELEKVKNLSESFLNTCKRANDLPRINNNINDIIKSIYELLEFEIQKRKIDFIIDISLINKFIYFNSYQLRQIFLNLIYNSIESNSKKIEVYSKNDNEENIDIYIKDDGTGIENEKQNKLFTPFFSTKLDGTGMGLVICREILHENHGNLKLISSIKGETIFCISFKKDESS